MIHTRLELITNGWPKKINQVLFKIIQDFAELIKFWFWGRWEAGKCSYHEGEVITTSPGRHPLKYIYMKELRFVVFGFRAFFLFLSRKWWVDRARRQEGGKVCSCGIDRVTD